MKELSIEEKAKAYDEAYEKAVVRFGSNVADEIFFKESEDERIVKELIEFININTLSVDERHNRWIAWVEKQVKHNNFRNKIRIGDKVTRNEDGVLVNLSQISRSAKKQGERKSIDELTQQEAMDIAVAKCFNESEQKPTDKVEPKFKVGDWIVFDNNVYYIGNIALKGYYECLSVDGTVHTFSLDIDSKSHLWTIQDAKPGDVLVCPKYANDTIPNIFIFKDIDRKDNDVYCYCSFLKTFTTEGYVASADPIDTDFCPATKEQRDTLIKAMADAGYTFDFEKKELRKIEQKHAWSEEDDINLEKAIWYIEHPAPNIVKNAMLVEWLKALKNRVQPQTSWKPSEEQMKALSYDVNLNGGRVYTEQWQILIDLYNDLKKLK